MMFVSIATSLAGKRETKGNETGNEIVSTVTPAVLLQKMTI